VELVPIRLDGEPQMILLNGGMDDPKVGTVRGGQGFPQVREQAARTELRCPPRSQRRVDRLLGAGGQAARRVADVFGWPTACDHPLAPPAPEERLGEQHPTHEHFLPLLVALGAAGAPPWRVTYPIEGFEFGSLSRLCVQLG
jgi:hypothetical protein